jgi:hypothetical protein
MVKMSDEPLARGGSSFASAAFVGGLAVFPVIYTSIMVAAGSL